MNNNDYCVYVHIVPNNKRYYGMTKNTKQRWQRNGYDYRNNTEFYEAIQLYGWDNIEHLVVVDNLTKEEAKELEEQLIRDYKTYDSNYGYNKLIGCKMTEEQKIAISGENSHFYGKDMAGENNPFYGRHHSEETKTKLSEANKGRCRTEETKNKISTLDDDDFDDLLAELMLERKRRKEVKSDN